MSQVLIALSVWVHALATVVFIGHYLLLSVIYLPVLAKNNATLLSEISKRSRPWMYVSLLIFMITGVYLMIADPNYLGVGKFGNAWGMAMFIKHLLVVAMIVFGFWFNAIWRVGPMMSSNTGAALGVQRFRLYSNLMAICGVLVLLLTAFAQVK